MMIEIRLRNQSLQNLENYSDLRIAESELINKSPVAQNYYKQLVPVLPRWTNKDYKAGSEVVNLYHLHCTCETYSLKRDLINEPRDIRRLCKHIYNKLEQTFPRNEIDTLTLLLIKSAAVFGEKFLFKYTIKKEDVYFGFNPSAEWINVYSKTIAGVYHKFAYQPVWERWAYGSEPPHSSYILMALQSTLKYQLPYMHNWVIYNAVEKKSINKS